MLLAPTARPEIEMALRTTHSPEEPMTHSHPIDSNRAGARRGRRAALGAGLLAVLTACAPAAAGIGDQIPRPITPSAPDGLISVQAENPTVRPERRDFSEERLRSLRIEPGFRIEVFADGLEQPRGIMADGRGNVYVAEREPGRVRLLRDTDGDGRADVSRVVAEGLGEGLSGVHAFAMRGDRLYMVTETEIHSAPIQGDGSLGERTLHIDDIPAGGQHPNRTMAFGPDGALYLSIGSTCNACVEPKEEHATMVRIDPATWEWEIYAEGLRNTIGFGWHPTTGEFWGLDHNSDGRGNNWPPEELNRIVEGRHYGWPFCGGDREVDWQLPEDPEEGTREEFCAGTEPPVLTYIAHAAPMQMVFYTGESFPAEYRNDAFATMRGSWNRNPPIGYEVVRIRFDEAGQPVEMSPFVTGWLIEGGRAHFGRLMGLTQLPDGSLLVGDDTNGIVYRVHHAGGS
jgi:glucose/arabinose dehydrogenase